MLLPSCTGILRSMILRQLAPHRLMQQPFPVMRMPPVPLEEEEAADGEGLKGMREVGSFQVRLQGPRQTLGMHGARCQELPFMNDSTDAS